MTRLYVAMTLSLMLLGCSGGTDRFNQSRPKTVAASGAVMYRNQPLADAIIFCFPTVGSE